LCAVDTFPTCFPFFKKEDIEKASENNKLLQITDKGKYSISKPIDADWITNIICKFCLDVIKKHPSTQVITDATAGIGGNVINFSKHFDHVNSIEINNVHYEVIKNNIEALGITNVTHIHDNFLNFVELSKHNDSLFFLDPPWGGKSYKNFKYFNLKLGKLMIYDIINILHKKGYKYVCLKAPINLNISPILSNCLYTNYNIHKNVGGNMLLIVFY
jgi:16S rRNA G966 N2-methylase RsmD